jgi:hydrogenase maturation protease
VLGVGNVLLGDEGVGVHAVRRLIDRGLPPGIEAFDGGTEGFGLLDVVSSCARLVVVDCVRGGEGPGTVYRFEPGEIDMVSDRYATSIHQVGILEILHLAALVGQRPRTTIVGVEPASLEIGIGPSAAVAARLEAVCDLALAEITAD